MLKRVWVGHLLEISKRSVFDGGGVTRRKTLLFGASLGDKQVASQEILKSLGICIATRLTVSHSSCQVLEGEPIHSSIKWKHTSVYK